MSYLISGKARREKKKELSTLKSYLQNFWIHENLHRIYGTGMDDKTCYKLIAEAEEKIKELELELAKPSIDIQRDNRLNQLGL